MRRGLGGIKYKELLPGADVRGEEGLLGYINNVPSYGWRPSIHIGGMYLRRYL